VWQFQFVSFILWSAFFLWGARGDFFHCGDPKKKKLMKKFNVKNLV
jgi:hypothetical protein